ncbi:acetyl/propionyl/methylcrotonyl-CoA carboxylase subunit alpha [uncultured Castellaniella sp.]|uniref:acetyl/propionyl/methylcrotonyl-CoA carboxylase subunit alpha n=1 Tax=uncultured Castellaniella sp. TaxID=647907 RepID=UPI00262C3CB5|nr:acetyl/propionyl/methylcrotonyl-CoA carboxylase subunit alpha [uncultured Castellaniella sp.]
MFDTILIANRGEIACRIAATARRMGIRTVAVYSEADARARHVQACDVAVPIGGPEPKASYLRADAILDAALRTGAQAIHPGYGFLSENAEFAQACADAGLAFIGPPARSIAAMGSKSAAKTLMAGADVPLVPGYYGDRQEPDFLQEQARAIGYPVLIKASAGGGGKGMRIVESDGEFAAALASCQREAASSFGNPQVLVERYLQKPRHIEIQVFADTHGQCVYLFERDCSVQRRFQKVIEEAPAPGMTPERRAAMGQAAVAAAQAVGYVGAGTVEFIAEPDGRFYFMEMNTRLQVEHPVTEAITGQDLVEWQLRVAAGEPLPLSQDQLRIQGHAIEARVYAENPDKDFLPSIGRLDALQWPAHVGFQTGPVRVDGGVREGDAITPYYDPMIAKLIVHGKDREQARRRMLHALAAVRATGLHTNIAFLGRLMDDPAFVAADLDTGLIPREHHRLFPAAAATPDAVLALAVAVVLHQDGLSGSDPLPAPVPGRAADARAAVRPSSPWQLADGWRVGDAYERALPLQDALGSRAVRLRRQGADWQLAIGKEGAFQPFHWQADGRHPCRLRIRLGDTETRAEAYLQGARLDIFADGRRHTLDWQDPIALASGQADDAGGGLTAPMPGKILSVAVATGDTVKQGQPLVVMEAMKMEHTIEAPHDGTVQEVFYAVGDQVTEGVTLIALDESGH